MGDEDEQESNKKKKGLIMIPSYQEVFDNSQPNPPPSLFRPSSSFSQAFSFIKSSEFYSPPPPPPSGDAPRQAAQSDASAPAPAPAPAPASASASSASPYPSPQSRNAILVGHRQKGNPLLKHIRNVKWMFADVVCDFLLGQSSCALYLSLRYHLLHPDYLYFRIRELQKNFKLRVVLCHVDVEDVVKPLLEVTRTALLHDCTLLCAWRSKENPLSSVAAYARRMDACKAAWKSFLRILIPKHVLENPRSLEECGRYLETLKVYENKPADSIQERTDNDYLSRLTHALTAVRHVNKTDVITLGSTFGSLSRVMDASMEELAHCPGIGERKVKRLYDTFHEPFRRVVSKPTTVQDSSLQDNAEPSAMVDSGTMETEKNEATANKHGKERSVSVRSALTAAFAKYADKVGKQDGSSSTREKSMETSSATLQEVRTGKGSSGEKQC